MKVKSVSFVLEQELQRFMTDDAKVFFLDTWYRYMFPYIPFVTGMLAEDVDISSDGIYFKTIYAHRQYEGTGFNFTRDFHPKAGAHWGQVAADLHGDAIVKEFKNYVLNKE